MKKINQVRFVMEGDDYNDFDCIGEYTDKIEDGVIVRHFAEFYEKLTEEQREDIPRRGRECRCFKPYAGGEKEGTDDYYKYGMKDYERAEDYNNGGWCFLVVHAEAEIVTGTKQCGLVNIVKSGHIGGIESDSDRSYFDEIRAENLGELYSTLVSLGFTKRQIDKAFEDVEEVTR